MKKARELFQFGAIGFARTPFRDKFGVPRQAALLSSAKGVLKIDDDPDLKTALRSLEEFSHIWIVFVFHEHGGKNWKPSIRPPRLGGSRKVGVLASRSPHRPNPIGISAVRIEKIDFDASGGPEIHVSGLDLIDGTPILDIKPYLAYADSIPDADPGWAGGEIERVPVRFAPDVSESISPDTLAMITEILELDPRPAYQKRKIPVTDAASEGSRFGVELFGFEFQYEIQHQGFYVLSAAAVEGG